MIIQIIEYRYEDFKENVGFVNLFKTRFNCYEKSLTQVLDYFYCELWYSSEEDMCKKDFIDLDLNQKISTLIKHKLNFDWFVVEELKGIEYEFEKDFTK